MPVFRNEPRMTTTVRGRGPVSERTVVKLKYNQQLLSNGSTGDHVFNLNSIFDPDRTGTGHQPYGHDTYASLYNRYRVFKAKVYIEFAVSDANVYVVGLMANNVTTTQTNSSLAYEKPNAISRLCTRDHRTRFVRTYNLPAICGSTLTQYRADDRYQAIFGASPGETICLHILWSDMNSAAPASSVVGANITVFYYIEAFDAVDLGQS